MYFASHLGEKCIRNRFAYATVSLMQKTEESNAALCHVYRL